MIGDIAVTLKKLLSLVPESATYFFETIVWKDIKNILDLMINCPEKQIRYHTSQLALHSINVILSQYKFELDLAKLKAREVNLINSPKPIRLNSKASVKKKSVFGP